MNLPSLINLEEQIGSITKPWTPIEIIRYNDQVVRLAMFEGSYHWHVHEGEDELFFVVRGQITIQVCNRTDIVLRTGEIAVMPRGIEHCPKSDGKSFVLMIEPSALQSSGDSL
ncbi:MAG: cupin domain-containing protein [Patescibacteria group bacterium]